ncbi:MAG: hypothetical protein RLZZ423_1896 [Cyanobacteriota bacterium]
MPTLLMPRLLNRVVSGLMVPAVVCTLLSAVLLTAPLPSQAASGGRIGGGSFRSAPSMPRSYGGSRSYGGGYGGGVQRGYGGGGIGFPFIVPFFFGGGGGLFGFLVLMAVVGLFVNALRGGGGGGGQTLPAGMRGGDIDRYQPDGPVAIAQVQVGLLATARELQRDLRSLAAASDTGSSAGLQRVLQESTLALLRHPDLWVYANAEVGQVPFQAAEATFNRLSMTERSKLSAELTSNVGGRVDQGAHGRAGDADATSDYIAVTLLLASRSRLNLRTVSSSDDLREVLRQLGAVPADQLLALEVIWQPEGAGEVLSADELITAYPNLSHL